MQTRLPILSSVRFSRNLPSLSQRPATPPPLARGTSCPTNSRRFCTYLLGQGWRRICSDRVHPTSECVEGSSRDISSKIRLPVVPGLQNPKCVLFLGFQRPAQHLTPRIVRSRRELAIPPSNCVLCEVCAQPPLSFTTSRNPAPSRTWNQVSHKFSKVLHVSARTGLAQNLQP